MPLSFPILQDAFQFSTAKVFIIKHLRGMAPPPESNGRSQVRQSDCEKRGVGPAFDGGSLGRQRSPSHSNQKRAPWTR